MLLIITDDAGFAVPSTFGGVIPTDTMDSARRGRAELHADPFHVALLADARGAHHRAQPPFGGLRRDLGTVDRLSRLQQHHFRGQGDDRADPARQRLQHLVVRQGPQHAGLRGRPVRPLRPVADGHGLPVLLRLRRRRREPVAAEPLPQHDADLSVRRAGRRMEPDHRHGRRRDRLDHRHAPDRPVEALLREIRARAPPTRRTTRRRNGSTRSRRCTSSTTATRRCARRSSRTRRRWASCRRTRRSRPGLRSTSSPGTS